MIEDASLYFIECPNFLDIHIDQFKFNAVSTVNVATILIGNSTLNEYQNDQAIVYAVYLSRHFNLALFLMLCLSCIDCTCILEMLLIK